MNGQRKPTQVGLLKSDDVVAGLHVGNALTNRLDNAGTLVTEDDGESALGVFAGKGVGIWSWHGCVNRQSSELVRHVLSAYAPV